MFCLPSSVICIVSVMIVSALRRLDCSSSVSFTRSNVSVMMAMRRFSITITMEKRKMTKKVWVSAFVS